MRPDAASFLRSASVSRTQHQAFQTFMRQTFAAYGANAHVTLVDLAPALCDDDACVVGTPSESYYWDASHLSEAGALRVSDELRRQSFGGVR